MLLLVWNDNVDVVDGAKTVIHNRKQTVAIGRKVDSDNLRTLVGDNVKETRILVCEAIVVLTPNDSSQQDVERSNLGTPLNFETLFDPFAVLVDHGVNDMNERLVAVEQSMPTTQEVTLKPTFAVVLRKHLDNTSSLGEVATIGILFEVLAHPDLFTSSVDTAKLVGLGLIRTKETEVGLVSRNDILEEYSHVGHASIHDISRAFHLDGIVPEVGHFQGLPEQTTISDRVGAHSSIALRNKSTDGSNRCTILIKQALRLIASHPVLENLEMGRVGGGVCDRNLVSSPVTLQVVVVNLSRGGPSLGASEDDHRPQRSDSLAGITSLLLDLSNIVHAVLKSSSHCLVHGLNVVAFNEIWLPAVTDEKALKFSVRDSSKNSRVVNLVTIEVENRQDSTINNWVEELVAVPGSSKRTSFGFAITNHGESNQVRVIKDSAESVRDGITQLTTLVEGSGSFGSGMRTDSAWEWEALEELLHTLIVKSLVGVDLGIDTLEVRLWKDSRSTMSWARDEESVKIVLYDQTVKVHICEDLARSRAKMTEQPKLEVLGFKWLSKKRILLEIDHTQGEVTAGFEKVIVLLNLLLGERLALDSWTSNAKGRDRLDLRRHGWKILGYLIDEVVWELYVKLNSSDERWEEKNEGKEPYVQGFRTSYTRILERVAKDEERQRARYRV
jgi:hypothetical protein